jgi:hypothetical protein
VREGAVDVIKKFCFFLARINIYTLSAFQNLSLGTFTPCNTLFCA